MYDGTVFNSNVNVRFPFLTYLCEHFNGPWWFNFLDKGWRSEQLQSIESDLRVLLIFWNSNIRRHNRAVKRLSYCRGEMWLKIHANYFAILLLTLKHQALPATGDLFWRLRILQHQILIIFHIFWGLFLCSVRNYHQNWKWSNWFWHCCKDLWWQRWDWKHVEELCLQLLV